MVTKSNQFKTSQSKWKLVAKKIKQKPWTNFNKNHSHIKTCFSFTEYVLQAKLSINSHVGDKITNLKESGMRVQFILKSAIWKPLCKEFIVFKLCVMFKWFAFYPLIEWVCQTFQAKECADNVCEEQVRVGSFVLFQQPQKTLSHLPLNGTHLLWLIDIIVTCEKNNWSSDKQDQEHEHKNFFARKQLSNTNVYTCIYHSPSKILHKYQNCLPLKGDHLAQW